MTGALQLFIDKMKSAALDSAVIDTFANYYRQVVAGETGLLSDSDLQPLAPEDVKDAGALTPFVETGKAIADKAVIIVLNGGLGTSMGLTKAKSLLTVKDGRSFLEIKLKQAEKSGAALAFMNSFNTHADTIEAVAKSRTSLNPEYFVQNKFPKILRSNLTPASWPKDPRLEWNPPGHGDIYTALLTSGLLRTFINNGLEFAFISNSDNLGATLDYSLLGYFADNHFPFMMEVAQRTPSELKGGHIAKLKTGGFVLREIAQCPENEIASFQDIGMYRYFNTNNIWINLLALHNVIQKTGGIYLPIILNPKTIDPRDKTSPKVYQIETAMGAAISLFQEAAVVSVQENRFLPVKKCNELLAVRSDCYLLNSESQLITNPKKTGTIVVKLDPRFFGQIDMFENRFKDGIPSLVDCKSLMVSGDVFFENNVIIKGDVVIRNTSKTPYVIKKGTIVDHSFSV